METSPDTASQIFSKLQELNKKLDELLEERENGKKEFSDSNSS